MYMHIKFRGQTVDVEPQKDNPLFCLNANLRKINRIVSKAYNEVIQDSDLKGTQFSLLYAISTLGELTIGEISEFLVMDQTTVTRSIQLLRDKGFVTVHAGSDRRERFVNLTDGGQTAVDETYPLWQKAQEAMWEKLGDEVTTLIFSLSEKLSDPHASD